VRTARSKSLLSQANGLAGDSFPSQLLSVRPAPWPSRRSWDLRVIHKPWMPATAAGRLKIGEVSAATCSLASSAASRPPGRRKSVLGRCVVTMMPGNAGRLPGKPHPCPAPTFADTGVSQARIASPHSPSAVVRGSLSTSDGAPASSSASVRPGGLAAPPRPERSASTSSPASPAQHPAWRPARQPPPQRPRCGGNSVAAPSVAVPSAGAAHRGVSCGVHDSLGGHPAGGCPTRHCQSPMTRTYRRVQACRRRVCS